MVDKNVNIIYAQRGAEQVARAAEKIAIANQQLNGSFTSVNQVGKQTISVSESMTGAWKQNRDAQGRFASGFGLVTDNIKQNIRVMEDHRQRFKMYLLSVMFFGMMIQRTFQKMAETTLNTFMKITEAQTTAGQAVTALSAHWEMLKFSVGEAIAQFIEANPWILEMIDSIADWVQQNDKLVSGITAVGLITGIIFGATGSIGLGIFGMKQFAIEILAGGTALKGFFAAAGIGGGPLLLIILAIVAVAVFLYKAWEENWFGIRNIVGTVVMGIHSLWVNVLAPVLKFMGDGFIFLMNIIGHVMRTIGYRWEGAWLSIQAFAYDIWNNLVGGIEWVVNSFVDFINTLIGIRNAIVMATPALSWLGEMKPFEHWDLSGQMKDTAEMKKRIEELNTLIKGDWNLTLAATFEQTKAWETQLDAISEAIKNAGLEIIQSGKAITKTQTEMQLEAAGWTPQELLSKGAILMSTGQPAQDFISRPGMQPIPFSSEDTIIGMKQPKRLGGETTVNIEYNVTGNNISSAVDLKQALREHNDDIMNTLKSYGVTR